MASWSIDMPPLYPNVTGYLSTSSKETGIGKIAGEQIHHVRYIHRTECLHFRLRWTGQWLAFIAGAYMCGELFWLARLITGLFAVPVKNRFGSYRRLFEAKRITACAP